MGPDDVALSLQSQGHANQLGNTTTTGALYIKGPATTCANGFLVRMLDVLTAANGDQLNVQIDMNMRATATPGVYQGDGTYQITGGTGRFVDASGAGEFHGTGDFNGVPLPTIVCNLSGAISIPGPR